MPPTSRGPGAACLPYVTPVADLRTTSNTPCPSNWFWPQSLQWPR